ncbi:MAG: SusD/RagB family nutrient-binding outer membrane lipoprotein [Bacteroidales bacterium]|nr:SusD/RagB family nutrient-binding outer membrane lipoprotein [Bacteroidales bacterium]
MKFLIKSKEIILATFVLVALLSSCTKDFEEMNKSPNNPVDVPAINIFTNTLSSSINRQLGGWIQHTYLGPWSQQWCKVQYIDEDRYMPRDMSGEFQAPYTSELKNLTIVIEKATEDGNNRLLAAAKIMRVWAFSYLTNVWGDIPYSQALQGFQIDGTLTPEYDTQESIYTSMLAELEQANVLLTGTTLNFGSGDILYGGDPVAWRKFANSLKLRLLNRAAGTPWSFTYNMAGGTQVTTTPGAAALATADAQIAAILGDPAQYPIFTSNSDNARLVYPGLPYRNPIYNTLYARTDQGISETMVDWLKARNDPRIHIYAQPTPNSVAASAIDYNGYQNGRGETSANFPTVSLLGTKVAYTETQPTFVLCYDEVQFIIAEHHMRGGRDEQAQAAYEAGIAASMQRWGLADGGSVFPTWGKLEITTGSTAYPVSYADYLDEALVAWGGTDAQKFQLINEQRWAGMFGQGVEAYCEIRRTGFPARVFEYELEASFYPELGLPIRVQYALSEDTYNTNNVASARLNQKIESINEGMFSTTGIQSQMWWHTRKNPIPTETDVK